MRVYLWECALKLSCMALFFVNFLFYFMHCWDLENERKARERERLEND